MLISRVFHKCSLSNAKKCVVFCSTNSNNSSASTDHEEFRVLHFRSDRIQQFRPKRERLQAQPPRTNKMPIDQDWGSVWPGPRSFHPATVPLPIRQGYVKKNGTPPDKYANAELMKIPNFLHLTPPVIKRQCEAIKKFCTPWPKELSDESKCEEYFPIEVTSSDYCHSSPTIRDPMARIVTVRFKLGALGLEGRCKDKFLRLVGDKYDEETDFVTIVADRCPLKKQNYDYAMYLITALYHESNNKESWEELKTEADMEYYDWNINKSKKTIESLLAKKAVDEVEVKQYVDSLTNYMNEGENDYTIKKYGDSVRKLLGLPEEIEA